MTDSTRYMVVSSRYITKNTCIPPSCFLETTCISTNLGLSIYSGISPPKSKEHEDVIQWDNFWVDFALGERDWQSAVLGRIGQGLSKRTLLYVRVGTVAALGGDVILSETGLCCRPRDYRRREWGRGWGPSPNVSASDSSTLPLAPFNHPLLDSSASVSVDRYMSSTVFTYFNGARSVTLSNGNRVSFASSSRQCTFLVNRSIQFCCLWLRLMNVITWGVVLSPFYGCTWYGS